MKFILTVVFAAATASAQVTLSPLFTNHAVLERGKPIPIWGTAAPGEKVEITLGPSHVTATADGSGAWHAMLPKLTAGGPYTLKANNATATDILIGEVWLASGQSNMEFTLKQVTDPKAALAASDHPNLRMFTVKRAVAADPTDNLSGTWQISSPATSGDFTAVGYYFAVSLLEHLKVPIGIIHSSWGGTPAEAWTPLQNLLADPVFMATANFQSAAYHALPASLSAYKTQLPAWEAQYHAAEPAMEDPGTIAAANDWKPISFPVSTADLPFKGAAVLWLRRMVTLPDNVPSVRAHIDLGYMLERDVVYVNGQEIVKQGYGDPEIGVPSRAADIPAGVLHPGENTILIRAYAHAPARQSLGHAPSAITIPTSQPGVNDTYPITGQWQYHLSFDQPVPADAIASLPRSPQMNVSNTPTALYNAMIYPLRDVSIAGALWYQGESNAGAAAKYPGLMADMIKGWRTQWGYDFPFYIVQLPLYQDRNFVAQRASQQQITRDVPNTAIAVTIDTGEVTNIHPKNKQPVGDRLALLALHRVYGEKIEDSGPFFSSVKPEGSKLRIMFTHAEGLHATSSTIPNFEIAGADGKFFPADAVIDKETILLSNPQIVNPTAARYAWSPTPLGVDVYNSADLPLAPFNTPESL